MRFLSVCSGIEAASAAWEPLGFRAAGFSEIEAFPSAVLEHRFPHVQNFGDFTQIARSPEMLADVGDVSLLVGGTPCQSFSVAGLRGGLSDARGNLALEFFRLAAACRPRWILWENVPGVLSSNGGRDFGAILGALAQLGYGFAWRVLDAQHFGVAQRRRRVFLVGCAGGWGRAASVLFESKGGSGLRQEGQGKNADAFERSTETDSGVLCREHLLDWNECGCWCRDDMKCPWCNEWTSGLHHDPEADGLSCCAAWMKRTCGTLSDGAHMGGGLNGQDALSGRLLVDSKGRPRRLTPLECERLQGFPDGWTDIPGAKDGPRFRAIGNSMAVPVMRWIGRRMAEVDAAHAHK